MVESSIEYLAGGIGNHFETEAIKGAIPKGQNSPQICPFDLYAEQLTGTSFLMPRHLNVRTWFYKIRPTVGHDPYEPIQIPLFHNDPKRMKFTPQQLRWKPREIPTEPTTFVQGIRTEAMAGNPDMKNGLAIYTYCANASMENQAFYSADGDMLIVPQQGTLKLKTECGRLEVPPLFVCVIPRGIKFQVNVSEPVRGYICETFKGHFTLPPLGPIGSNGLANPRDFEAPTAWYEDVQTKFEVISKFAGELFTYTQDYSCFDVVAWHGNYYPCRYNLELFNTMNTVSYDHPDPSIFTVLTCPTDEPGVSACDFVIFPPRWMCSEKTFRPPYYHRNNMNEYMGNIRGTYDAKENGFMPGGGSLHSTMTGHGPEAEVFKKASTVDLKPVKYAQDSMAFMFETTYFLKVALDSEKDLDNEYYKCWKGIEKLFKSPQ